MEMTQTTVVNFLIADLGAKKFIIQRRSPDRTLFPNRWEIPGGHLKDGESELNCIRRELLEELSLDFVRVIGKIHEFFWDSDPAVKDVVYMIVAKGHPKLEEGKATEYRWIDREESGLLLRPDMNTSGPYEAAVKAFDYLDGLLPIIPHDLLDASPRSTPNIT